MIPNNAATPETAATNAQSITLRVSPKSAHLRANPHVCSATPPATIAAEASLNASDILKHQQSPLFMLAHVGNVDHRGVDVHVKALSETTRIEAGITGQVIYQGYRLLGFQRLLGKHTLQCRCCMYLDTHHAARPTNNTLCQEVRKSFKLETRCISCAWGSPQGASGVKLYGASCGCCAMPCMSESGRLSAKCL